MDTIAILSQYNSFSVRVTDIKRNSEEFQISYLSSNSRDGNEISIMKWILNRKIKGFNWGKKIARSNNWDEFNYRADDATSYICNSHMKSWLYPFLK